MMRSDENSSKTDNFSFLLFVFHQTVTSTFPIVSVKRSSAILRVDVVGLIGDFIGCTAECLTTLTEIPESTIAHTTPIPVTSMVGRRVGLSREFTARTGTVPALSVSVQLPFFINGQSHCRWPFLSHR